jgi:Flp pilus assembly protein TadD
LPGITGAKEAVMARSAGSKRHLVGCLFAPIFLATVLVGCQTAQPGDVTGALDPAVASRGVGPSRQAATSLSERYRANPNDPMVAIRYAQALRESGKRLEAIAVLERAALHNPRHSGLFGAYGRALAELGDYENAFDVFNRVHAADRPDWRVLSIQGAVLDEMGRHEEAQRYYGTALRMAPNEPSVLSNLGLSYALAKDLVRAETTLRQAATQSRGDPGIRQNLALVMTLQGRFSVAEDNAPATLRVEAPAATALREQLARQNGWTEASQPEKPQIRAEGR